MLHIIFCLLMLIGGANAAPHVIRNIGTNEGLGDLLVNAIYEDPNGLIWFGTGSSLELFDGVELTHYPLPGEDNRLQRVEAISGNTQAIYFCNNHTLYRLDRAANELTTILEGQIAGILRDLQLVNNHLYIATSAGLYIYDVYARTVHPVLFNPTVPDAPQNELRHLRSDAHGNLWLTSKAGLHMISPDGTLSHYYYSDLPADGFSELAISDSIIYLASFHRELYAFDIATGAFRFLRRFVSPIVSIQCYNSQLMVATDGDGVLLLDPQSLILNPLSSKLSSSSVYRAMIDSRGILWVGHYQNGLDYTLGQTEQFGVHHTDMLSTEGMAVRSLAINGQQRLIGTRQGLYYVDKKRHRMVHYDGSALNAKMIFALLYHEGYYYIGTYGGGLFTLNEQGTQLCPLTGRGIGEEIFSITTDSVGQVWVGSNTGVTALRDRRVVRHFSSSNSILPPGLAYCVFFDCAHRGWFCTAGGVVRYDVMGDSLTAELPDDFPAQMVVRSIYRDRQHQLYFMPDRGDTYVVDSLLHPITNIPVPVGDNLFMIEDSLSQLWIGTKSGLYCLHTDRSLHRYGFANGLPSETFTLCQPQIDHEGTVWLGNSEGLIYLKPDSVALLQPRRPVMILGSQIEERCAIFAFSDLSYSDPNSMYYECMLEARHGGEWTVVQARNSITYSSLKSGKYRFRVRVMGEPDTESVCEITIPLSTGAWVAIIGSVFAGILLLFFVAWYRAHRRLPGEEVEMLTDVPARNKYANVSLTQEALDALHLRVDEMMAQQQLYLRTDLKIADIAHEVGVPPYQLSYLFTQYLQTTFYDYIYHYRIEEFKRRVQAGDIRRYTVESLAEQCGFSSRASFFRNFKKEVGMTPNEYIKSIKTADLECPTR